MEEGKKTELEDLIFELEGYRGRHTELISLYVPAGTNINLVSKQVEQEKGTASNIKSKATRNNVVDALERISRHLKLYKQIPDNGLVVFCGNISETEGQPKIELWNIEPPQPLNAKLYRCDQEFVLEPLKEMLQAKDVYGLIVVDRQEASLGLLEGKSIKALSHMTSGVPGKQKKGGQSAARYSRVREAIIKEFYKRIAEEAKTHFFNRPRLKGILIGGPGLTKDLFLDESQMITALKEKIIAVKAISYTNVAGLEMLVDACKDVLAAEEITKEKELLNKFFTLLGKEKEKVCYGVEKTKKALEVGAASHILISKSIDKAIARELEKSARATDAEITIISTETEEGIQFRNIGGVGAFLRYAIE